MQEAIVGDRNEAFGLLDLFNSFHRNLHFTIELESDRALPFLDVMTHKGQDGSFSFSVFRKRSWTGVYTSFHSFVPVAYKRALVKNLYTRAIRLSSPVFLDAEFDFIFLALRRNAYPADFINKHKITNLQDKPIECIVEKKPIFLRVPFYGDKTANSLRRSFSTLISQKFFAAKPILLFRTTPIPSRSPKDRLPDACSSSLVYKFTCDCGAVYIGRTSRRLETRVREHLPKWLIGGRSGRANSSITSHVLECNCLRGSIREKFSIVFRARSDRLLRILEALAIKAFKPALCRQKEYVIDLLLPW